MKAHQVGDQIMALSPDEQAKVIDCIAKVKAASPNLATRLARSGIDSTHPRITHYQPDSIPTLAD